MCEQRESHKYNIIERHGSLRHLICILLCSMTLLVPNSECAIYYRAYLTLAMVILIELSLKWLKVHGYGHIVTLHTLYVTLYDQSSISTGPQERIPISFE
jgi:hypothetical protein